MRRTWGWLAAVATTVAAVVLVLALPHALHGAGTPQPTVPRPTTDPADLDSPSTQTWQPIGCPAGQEQACVAPLQLDHGGAVFRRLTGVSQPVVAAGGVRRTILSMVAVRTAGDRWVLAGAEHATAESRLQVSVGSASAITVLPGKLSLLPLPRTGRVVVTVTDRGSTAGTEVLRIEQYTDR